MIIFFEDLENQDPKAVELFNKETEQIYFEENKLEPPAEI